MSLDAETYKLERVIAELRSVDLDDVPEEHDSGDVVWTSEDAGNVASDTLAREVGFGLIEEFQSALDEVRLARQRLSSGRYGTCDGCGASIAPGTTRRRSRDQVVPSLCRWLRRASPRATAGDGIDAAAGHGARLCDA